MSGTTGDNENPFLDLPTFNPDNFLLDTDALTIEDADDRYVKLSGSVMTGLLTCGSSLAVTGTLTVNGNDLSAELGYLDVTPGTAEASKALVLDASKDIGTLRELTSQKINLAGGGYTTTPINILDSTLSSSSVNISFGHSAATNNQAFLYFYYAGDESTSNYIGLSLYTTGTPLKIYGTGDVDLAFHNGSTAGLKLGGTLVTSTAAQLNYCNVTPGTASASKSLVLDASSDISGINSLSATSLTGTLQTAAQTNITSVGTLTSLATGNITLNGTLITSTAQELNYVDVTRGAGTAERALVLDSAKNVTGINYLSATTLGGTLNTTAQPNITSVGTLTSLATGDITLNGTLITSTAAELNYNDVTPGTATASKALVLDASSDISGIDVMGVGTLTITGNSQNPLTVLNSSMGISSSSYIKLGKNDSTNNSGLLRFYHISDASASNYLSLGIASNLDIIKVYTGYVDITESLRLSGTTVTATAAELNYNDVTPGTATASKSLVLDASKDIATINSLTATSITGTLQTAAQPNITSVGTLTSLATGNITLNGTLITATAAELNYNDVTPGAVTASKSLVVDSNKDIGTIREITSQKITINPNGYTTYALNILDNTMGANDKLYTLIGKSSNTNNSVFMYYQYVGSASTSNNMQFSFYGSSAALRIYASKDIDIPGHNGSTVGLQLGGTLVTSTADQLNYTDISTPGTAEASKALVLDATSDITGINDITANSLTLNDTGYYPLEILDSTLGDAESKYIRFGKNDSTRNSARLIYSHTADGSVANYLSIGLQGYANPLEVYYSSVNISSLQLAGTSVTATAAELNYCDVTPGSAAASKALVLNSSKNISGINDISADKLTLDDVADSPLKVIDSLMGSGAQKYIKLGKAESSNDSGYMNYYYTASGSSSNYLGLGLYGNSVRFKVYPSYIDITTLYLGGTAITSSATELNYNDVVPGQGTASKTLVLDSSKDVDSIRAIGAQQLNLTVAGYTIDPVQVLDSTMGDGDSMYLGFGKESATANKGYIKYNHVSDGSTSNNIQFLFYGVSAPLKVTADQTVDIVYHNGSTKGLRLANTLVTATAAELNYCDVTAGTATANKALVTDGSNDISSINDLYATSLTGGFLFANGDTTDTPISALSIGQSDSTYRIFKLGYADSTNNSANMKFYKSSAGSGSNWMGIGVHGADDAIKLYSGTVNITKTLQLSGTSVTATAAELNYLDITTIGTGQASKALVLDSNRDIEYIRNLQSDGSFKFTGTTSNYSIGTASASFLLEIGALTDSMAIGQYWWYDSAGNDGEVSSGSGTASVSCRMAGRLLVDDEIDILSSRDTKKNIEDINDDDVENFVDNVNVKTFNKLPAPTVPCIGIIAQDAAKAGFKSTVSSIVRCHQDPDAPEFFDEETGIKTKAGTRLHVNYNHLGCIAFQHSKLQKQKIIRLEEEVDSQKEIINLLNKQIEKMDTRLKKLEKEVLGKEIAKQVNLEDYCGCGGGLKSNVKHYKLKKHTTWETRMKSINRQDLIDEANQELLKAYKK